MAWQSHSAIAGNGGAVGGGGEGNNNGGGQLQGTEYTLQGVMRFLQTEWHRHERDRNAWEIERAEMKSRIGKLEGDGRTSKRMQESLGKHVKILENALKKEREKAKSMVYGDKVEGKRDEQTATKGALKPAMKPQPPKPHNSFLDTEGEDLSAFEMREDTDRDKSRTYLGKCVQEVTYHAVPPAHPPSQFDDNQQELASNHNYPNQNPPQQSLEEVYMQQRQKQQQHAMMNPSPLPNHQPPPIPLVSDVPNLSRTSNQAQQASFMTRNLHDQHPLPQNAPVTAIDNRSRSASEFGPTQDDQIERVTHSYDSRGRPIPSKQEDDNVRISEEPESADAGGWNFDEPPEPQIVEDQSSEYSIIPRPDTDLFPSANSIPAKSPPRGGPGSHRRKSSSSRRRPSDGSHELRELSSSHGGGGSKADASIFKVRFALRGHLDVVRSVIFTGGGSPSEPEICTTGDDGVIKRWIIPASYGSFGLHGSGQGNDLDIPSYFTHRGHTGSVMSLAACPASPNFSNGGRALGDGWVFSGGQDAMVRVWERGRVDPKATLDGHTDAVWSICVLPGTSASVLGDQCNRYGGPDRIILASGSADGTILIWAVSAPPQLTSPHTGSRRGAGGSRRANSVSSGSNFPSSPQPSTASPTSFHYCLLHRIERADHPAPT
ncbi:MAG: hypothetical protein M1830_000891, partial [Pleopsidium flavum]